MSGIWKYSPYLPDTDKRHRLSLGEGSTPLVRSRNIGPSLGLRNLYFKLEQVNPSGSYKDRFAAAAVSDLLQRGVRFCVATSSGNTGAALAAYCAAANIGCFLAIVDGAPEGKVRQMQVYGATTMMIRDFGLDPTVTTGVFEGLQAMARAHGSIVQISAYRYSPAGMAGVQTLGYELAEAMAGGGHVFSPAGGGGLTLAVAKGFAAWEHDRPGFLIPRVHCVQPSGNDTIAGPLRAGDSVARAVERSTTSVSGLQVPNVIDGDDVIRACRETQGTGFTVSDEMVYDCQERLAQTEGIYCEPAGAVALAGAIEAVARGKVAASDPVVCLVTGHGFKDPASANRIAGKSEGLSFGTSAEALGFLETQIASIQQ